MLYNQLWLWCIIFITSKCYRLVAAIELFAECEGVEKINTFVASNSDCAKYIYCDGVTSFEGECLDDNYFNEKAEQCDDRTVVHCKIGNNGTEHMVLTSAVPTGRNDGISVAVNEYEHVTTVATITSSGIISNNSSNDITTMATMTTTVAGTTSTTAATTTTMITESIIPSDVTTTAAPTPHCPLAYGIANLIHLPNPTSCSTYYVCYNGIAIPMVCPQHMYFNANSGKCERQELVYCEHSRPLRLNCHKGVYAFMPHPHNCKYYYYCSNGFLMILQCPFECTWHYQRQVCVHRLQSKCFSNHMHPEMKLNA